MDILGWSLSKVKQYSALKAICPEAWGKVTQTQKCIELQQGEGVTEKVTNVTFSKGILRPIINLTPDQQLELVENLATGKINKNRFKVNAEKSNHLILF